MSHFILWASVAFSAGSDKECLPHRTFEKVNMTLCVKTLCRCLEMSASFPRGGWRNAEGRELYQPGTAAQEPNLSSASLLFTYLQVRRGDSCRLGIGRGGSALLAWFRGSCWRDRHYQSILMAESEAHRWGVLLKLRHRRVRSLAPTGLAQCVCGNTRYLQQGELWSHTQRAWMQRGWEPGKTKSSPLPPGSVKVRLTKRPGPLRVPGSRWGAAQGERGLKGRPLLICKAQRPLQWQMSSLVWK